MVSNVEILTEVKAIHAELVQHKKDTAVLIEIAPDLKSMADLYAAGKVGGSALKWVATLGASILGLVAFVKLAFSGMLGGVTH